LSDAPFIVIGFMEKNMRKIVLAFAALAAFGFILPVAAPAKAEEATLVIKTGDRDHYRDHDRRWHRDRDHHQKVVIIKKHRDRDRDHDND
jgi:Ni/Co efflux regulator RcnB